MPLYSLYCVKLWYHVWLSGVFGSKSVSLECITGQSERSRADFGHIQASFEDLLLHVILDVSHVRRTRDFLVMRYISVRFTYLLTYLHVSSVLCEAVVPCVCVQLVFCDVTGRESRLPLTICAEGLPPRLQLSLDTLDTGAVFSKTSHHYDVVLANRGLVPAEFLVRLPDTAFSRFIDVQPRAGRLDVDGYQALQLSLNADRLGNFEEFITVSVKGNPHDIVMKLRYLRSIFVNFVLNPLMSTVAIWVQL